VSPAAVLGGCLGQHHSVALLLQQWGPGPQDRPWPARTGGHQVEAEGDGVSVGRSPSLAGLDRVPRLLTSLQPFR